MSIERSYGIFVCMVRMWRASNREYIPVFMLLARVVVGFYLVATASAALATPTHDKSVCDSAAHSAARESGVPASVLLALTRTETGRARQGDLQPWPWTVNMEGRGFWFDTEDEARSFVFREFKRGARSFDVGCFQINYKWHGRAFSSIDEMFDPNANARYAAKFLGGLHAEFGNWSAAAGAYHSRTRTLSEKYASRFDRILAKISAVPDLKNSVVGKKSGRQGQVERSGERNNQFPLLQPQGVTTLGSLVPVTSQKRSLFDMPSRSGS